MALPKMGGIPQFYLEEPSLDGGAGGNGQVADAGAGAGGGQVVEPSPVSLKDTDLIEVQVDGAPVRKPWSEVKGHIMRQEDYTRKTQGVATKAKELQTLYDGLTAKQKELFEKEMAIDSILGRAPKKDAAESNPDDVLTVAQADKRWADKEAALEAKFNARVAAEATRVETDRQYQRWEDKTNETVEALTKEHPVLEDIPALSAVLKREAAKTNPSDEKEMVKAIVEAGKQLADRLDKRYTDRQKEAAVRKQNLTQKGPVAPGGTPQFSTKKTYGKGRSIDWKDLEADVMSALTDEV